MKQPYRLWAGDTSTISGLMCLFQPICEFDGAKMELGMYKPLEFGINDGSKKKNAHAVDVVMICPECGFKDVFGVAVSKAHYDSIQKYIKFHPKKIAPYFVRPETTV